MGLHGGKSIAPHGGAQARSHRGGGEGGLMQPPPPGKI